MKLTFLGSFGEPVPPAAPPVGSSIAVDGPVHIGRDGSSTIVLRQGPHSDQNAVARRHAIVERAEGGVRVRDLGSTNGVMINGVRITDGVAPIGATIVIANFHHFRVDGDQVNLDEQLARVTEHWRPAVVGRFNEQEIKVVKLHGPFVWHRHDDTDEVFLVWRGAFHMEYRDHSVELREGDMIVVARGVEHRPVAEREAEVLLFEARNTRNTGNVHDDKLTAP